MNHHLQLYLNVTNLMFQVLQKVMLAFLYRNLNLQRSSYKKFQFYLEFLFQEEHAVPDLFQDLCTQLPRQSDHLFEEQKILLLYW